MGYGTPGLAFADNPSIDAFGRLRVGQPQILLDSKQVGNTPDLLTSNLVSGSGAVTYSVNRSSTYLTVGTAIGAAVRQTRARAVYQPGKSLLVFQTFVMAPGQTNLTQRVGLFDGTPGPVTQQAGIFLQLVGTTLSLVKRTYLTGSVVDTAVAQASWNIDKMDGTGPSGLTLDITKAQILMMDLEWLGVGRCRIGFVINGLIYYVHQFVHSNLIANVYISNPNLPLRWEIQATGTVTGTPQLEAICGSVSSEGGYEPLGFDGAADNQNTLTSLTNGTWGELCAIRIQAAFLPFATAYLQGFTTANDKASATTGVFLYRVVWNPTATGAGAWSALTNSILEKNTTRTVTADTGLIVAAGYGGAAAPANLPAARPMLTMGMDLTGLADVYSLQVRNVNLGTSNFVGTLNWREIT